MKAKLKNYKKYKERNKEHELDSAFQEKKVEVIWTSRTLDMGQTLNNVRVAGQIQTSLLLL